MKKITSMATLAMTLTSAFAFFPVAAVSAKAPEFGMSSVKAITEEIAEINTAENFILLGKGKGAKKKVLTAGAVIVKSTVTETKTGTLSDLVKGQKAHLWVLKKTAQKGALQAIVITQFLGAQALASQPPVVQFALTASQGAESIAPLLITSLSRAAGSDVKISYTVTGTATGGGTDYTLASGDLVIAAGQTTGVLPLMITNDTLQETDETVIVTLTAATNATLGTQKVHTYTINDNDQSGVGFSSASGSGAESAGAVNIPVTLSAAATQEVKVDYTLSGTATGSGTDYTLVNGTLTIPAGQTSGNITATVVDDASIESSETIIVTLSNARGATLTANTVYTYTINDNDQPTIGFSTTSGSGSEAVLSVNIPVTLSTASTKEAKVNYAVTGTATGSGTDYTLANGTLTIPAGQTSANIALAVINDTTDELDETVIVTLSSPTDATLATSVYTYTIQDNDNPVAQFSSATANGGENVTPVNIAVTLSAAPAEQVQVNYTVSGTATGGGVDYTLANGTLTISAGQTSGNISLAVVDDVIVDPGETVIVTLSSSTNATLGSTVTHTYTINDND
jgi:hypothetical protein